MKLLIFLSSIWFFQTNPPSHLQSKRQFVGDKWVLAVQEMHRSGIPASVTMAQCILESNWGQSELALVANNYFGIKCKDYWTGEALNKKDDDRNSKGQLIPSCFRQYPSMEASFNDHSDFLLTSPNYAILFDLDHKNYKSWCMGLQSAGYATDLNYANKLIAIIESYQLMVLDDVNEISEYNLLPIEDNVFEIFASETSLPPTAYKLPDNYTPRFKLDLKKSK